MSEQIRNKLVNIKKRRRCFACQRSFEQGRVMFMGTYRDEGRIYNLHTCTTCNTLLTVFEYGYDDNENGFLPGCVGEGLSPGQTPEMLLEELRNKKTPTP